MSRRQSTVTHRRDLSRSDINSIEAVWPWLHPAHGRICYSFLRTARCWYAEENGRTHFHQRSRVLWRAQAEKTFERISCRLLRKPRGHKGRFPGDRLLSSGNHADPLHCGFNHDHRDQYDQHPGDGKIKTIIEELAAQVGSRCFSPRALGAKYQIAPPTTNAVRCTGASYHQTFPDPIPEF